MDKRRRNCQKKRVIYVSMRSKKSERTRERERERESFIPAMISTIEPLLKNKRQNMIRIEIHEFVSFVLQCLFQIKKHLKILEKNFSY